MKPHYYQTRIYYVDTDANGVVYHGHYLAIFERARTEALRSLGISLIDLLEKSDCTFAARHVSIDYNGPLFLDDAIEVETTVIRLRPASVTFQQLLYRVGKKETILTKLDIKMACVNRAFKVNVFPESLVAELSS